jgi:cell division protein FtsQ
VTAPNGRLALDIRLMNSVSLAVFGLAAATLLAAGVMWLMRAPWFAVRAIEIHGDVQRNSLPTIRANAVPRLKGNFFSLDLQAAREAFESVPWVRRAVVRRVWPDRLAVRIEEHEPVARWSAEDGSERLVNRQGEVFEANLGDIEADALPLLGGPDGSAAQVLQMFRQLQPLLARLDREPLALELSGRGSWSVQLDGEAEIELGRGTPQDVLERTERFVATVTQVTGYYKAPLLRADLRHPGGYALRLRGVTTTEAAAAGRNK